MRRLIWGEPLDETTRGVALLLTSEAARRTGLDRSLKADGRKELEQELIERQQNLILPRKGHPLRPANAGGTTYIPVPPLVG
jgi:hypothetical protein